MIRKILKWIWVIQFKKTQPDNNFERTYKRRLNPYNPLTYVVILTALSIGIILFGIVGIWRETDLKNDFKWR